MTVIERAILYGAGAVAVYLLGSKFWPGAMSLGRFVVVANLVILLGLLASAALLGIAAMWRGIKNAISAGLDAREGADEARREAVIRQAVDEHLGRDPT